MVCREAPNFNTLFNLKPTARTVPIRAFSGFTRKSTYLTDTTVRMVYSQFNIMKEVSLCLNTHNTFLVGSEAEKKTKSYQTPDKSQSWVSAARRVKMKGTLANEFSIR